MTALRVRHGVKPYRGSWGAALWYAVAFFAAGIAFTSTVPLAARVMLARAAEGFVPGTLAVERVVFPRRTAGGRGFAYGRLADGSEARLVVEAGARPPIPPGAADTGGAERPPGAVTPPMELQVLVNPRLAGTWLHRQRVQWPEADLRGRAMRQAGQLLAAMGCSLVLAVLAWRRLRRLRTAP